MTTTKAAHTPGPWNVTEILTVEDSGHNPVRIASINKFESEREANARLIAAAPEMLEALEYIACMLDHKTCTSNDVTECQRKAEAAIQKARGE